MKLEYILTQVFLFVICLVVFVFLLIGIGFGIANSVEAPLIGAMISGLFATFGGAWNFMSNLVSKPTDTNNPTTPDKPDKPDKP
jgi:hypothetical protein